MTIVAPYNIPNFLIDGYDVVVNRPKTAAYRAPGRDQRRDGVGDRDRRARRKMRDRSDRFPHHERRQGRHAADRRTSFQAHRLSSKPSRRSKTARITHPSSKAPIADAGWPPDSGSTPACSPPRPSTSIPTAPPASSTGSVDIGGSRAAMAMIAAEVLGLDVNDVRPIVADTDSIGHTDVTGGSRTTFATGMAVYEAAQDALRQLKERAAKLWEKKPEEVELRRTALQRARRRHQADDVQGARSASGAHRRPDHRPRDSQRARRWAGASPRPASTSKSTRIPARSQVLRATIAQDAGNAIHPSYVEGQMQGGTAQGIGWALNEEYFYDDKGILRNTGLLDYRMPTCLDLPMIETDHRRGARPRAIRWVSAASARFRSCRRRRRSPTRSITRPACG